MRRMLAGLLVSEAQAVLLRQLKVDELLGVRVAANRQILLTAGDCQKVRAALEGFQPPRPSRATGNKIRVTVRALLAKLEMTEASLSGR